ncbi:hypothetical protein CYLTODRAFT_426698 [Cylindrobasidium torrendii FP15055 ss-10]|uniref:RING-type E3 ubiquitin transferase n=1 Tax=Cylindrobasidium torrendii FP15055 ss-10 TaxID=1314674 RepID=A0A0D7AXN1_9AGAR|nr:hypothetical protein CYLTODRAFT_426698 [Cylindrobasidium torrendii FP15055 ss-10]
MDDPEAGFAAADARQRRSGPGSFIFFMVILFLLTHHNGDEFLARHQYQHALESLDYQLSNFSAWMNGSHSNFTLEPRDALLEDIVHRFTPAHTSVDPAMSAYCTNITGVMRGETTFHNISLPFFENRAEPRTKAASHYVAGTDVTDMGDTGDKTVVGYNNSDLAHITGRLEVTDGWNGEDLNFEFEGVHFISNGSIYGFAEPYNRPIDLRLLPSLVPKDYMNDTAKMVQPILASRIKKLKQLIDEGVIEADDTTFDNRLTTCPFTVFAQLAPSHIPKFRMDALEEEMQHPTGAPVVKAPKMHLKGVLMSKECGLVLEIKDAKGQRSFTFYRKVTAYAGTAGVAYLILLYLLSKQMERSRTPAGLSRASRWMFFTQATIDAVSFAGHVTFAIIAEGKPSISLTAPAFLACTMFVAFDSSARLWLGMFVFLTLIVRVIPSPLLSLIFVASTYSLIWAPQIVRSVRRGRSSGLSKAYIAGTTAARLYIALYFLLCPDNVLEVESRPWAAYLALFVCAQALTVILQDTFGPAFFVPSRFAQPKMYDYHPILPVSDAEAPEQLGDCAICMDSIELNGKQKGDGPRTSLENVGEKWERRLEQAVGRKHYSLAPCSHLFHTECLEKWLAIKNICPQCRRPLPPL